MIESFVEAGVALIENVIVGERNDFNAARFQGFEKRDGCVELKRLGADRMLGSNGSFEVDEAEIGLAEDVSNVGEQRIPASVIAGNLLARGRSFNGGRGVDDWLVRNHVARDGEGHAADLLRIGDRFLRRPRANLPDEEGNRRENAHGEGNRAERESSVSSQRWRTEDPTLSRIATGWGTRKSSSGDSLFPHVKGESHDCCLNLRR